VAAASGAALGKGVGGAEVDVALDAVLTEGLREVVDQVVEIATAEGIRTVLVPSCNTGCTVINAALAEVEVTALCAAVASLAMLCAIAAATGTVGTVADPRSVVLAADEGVVVNRVLEASRWDIHLDHQAYDVGHG